MGQQHVRGCSLPTRHRPALPSLEAMCRRLNQRINAAHEPTLLAFYERHQLLLARLAPVTGAERRYINQLARRHGSSLYFD